MLGLPATAADTNAPDVWREAGLAPAWPHPALVLPTHPAQQ